MATSNDRNDLTIPELLQRRSALHTRLHSLPFAGTPEVKTDKDGRKYIYLRKRHANKVTSNYVGVFSDDLYREVLSSTSQARAIGKELRRVDRSLAKLGYSDTELSPRVQLNIDFARINMKANIYDQAVLEGVATSFPQTEEIIDNGIVHGVQASDVQKILNLKHAWEFLCEDGVALSPTDFTILSTLAGIVNEGFYRNGGHIRPVPVRIGGTSYTPPLPDEFTVKETIRILTNPSDETATTTAIDVAIRLALYVMRTQILNDGNKRSGILFANHYLISHGEGLLIVPENHVPEFKRLLVQFYESNNESTIANFLRTHCWLRFDS